jgi:hypothetical protein
MKKFLQHLGLTTVLSLTAIIAWAADVTLVDLAEDIKKE